MSTFETNPRSRRSVNSGRNESSTVLAPPPSPPRNQNPASSATSSAVAAHAPNMPLRDGPPEPSGVLSSGALPSGVWPSFPCSPCSSVFSPGSGGGSGGRPCSSSGAGGGEGCQPVVFFPSPFSSVPPFGGGGGDAPSAPKGSRTGGGGSLRPGRSGSSLTRYFSAGPAGLSPSPPSAAGAVSPFICATSLSATSLWSSRNCAAACAPWPIWSVP